MNRLARKVLFASAGAALVIIAAPPAFPQAEAEPMAAETTEKTDASLFAQGRTFLLGAASGEFGDEGEGQYAGRAGAGYFLLDGLSIGAETLFGVADPKGAGEEALAGLDVVLRWHALRFGEIDAEWSRFLDVGGGGQWTSDEFPEGNRFNFRERLGFGATFEMAPDVSLFAGASFFHVSNANLGDINPGLTGTLAYAGVMVAF